MLINKKKIFLLCTVIVVILNFMGCSNNKIIKSESENVENKIAYFKDAKGNKVNINVTHKRVISLLGSFAETWILSGGELVGVTSDVVDEKRLKLDDKVKIVGTVKNPNLEVILALNPDFVILSADIDADAKVVETLKKAGIKYAFFKVESFSDYLNMLKNCTDITGRKDLYKTNGLDVKNKIDSMFSKIDKTKKPTALLIRAFSTGAKAKGDDNMTGAMLKDLGLENIVSRHASLLEDLSIEEIIAEDPKYIFVVTMGDSNEALESLKKSIQSNLAWNGLDAVKNNRYIILPKELFHYKPNVRWGDAYEYLAKILYPETFK